MSKPTLNNMLAVVGRFVLTQKRTLAWLAWGLGVLLWLTWGDVWDMLLAVAVFGTIVLRAFFLGGDTVIHLQERYDEQAEPTRQVYVQHADDGGAIVSVFFEGQMIDQQTFPEWIDGVRYSDALMRVWVTSDEQNNDNEDDA